MVSFIARVLPGLAPGLTAFLNPWVLVIAGVLFVAGIGTGFKIESWRWDASLKDIAEANIAYIKTFVRKDAQINAAVSAKLARDREKLNKDRSAFQRKLNNARKDGPLITIPEPSPADGTTVVGGTGLRLDDRPAECNVRCIGLYHDGLAQGLPEAYGAWRADAEAAAPNTVTADELIVNAAENFAIGNYLRSQILGWQQWACDNGLFSGPECGKEK